MIIFRNATVDLHAEIYDLKKQLDDKDKELKDQEQMMKDYISNRVSTICISLIFRNLAL